jgi:hypothetical protein
MKAVLSAPRRGWLVAALVSAGSLAIGSCTDNTVAPIRRAPIAPPEKNAGAGNAQTLTYTLSADPVDGSAYLSVPDSIRFKHLSWVHAVASGSVRRVATYPWTEVPNDTTFDASQGFSYVDIGSGNKVYIGTTPVDMELIYYSGYQAPAGVGFLGHGAGTIDLDNYAPPGYPHVDCGRNKPIHCETYSGSITITITPYHSDLMLTADSTTYHPGSIASFNLFLSPTTVNGHALPYTADSSWWVPDSDTAGGDPSEQAMSGPGLAAMGNPSTGHRVIVGSGTMSVSGWVNGEWQKKSVHLGAPALKLTTNTSRVRPGDSVTFTPSWTDGASVSAGNITGWTWTPAVPPGHSTTCATVMPCKAKIQDAGTMKVSVTRNGVTRTAKADVGIYSSFRLDVDRSTALYGDTATFTPKYDDLPGSAARWRWVPADTSSHDTLACDPGVTFCKKRMIGSGTMWAYTSSTPGSGDSASKQVTVASGRLTLSGGGTFHLGEVASFAAGATGGVLVVTNWSWNPGSGGSGMNKLPRLLPRLTRQLGMGGKPPRRMMLGSSPEAPCSAGALTCADTVGSSGMMSVFGTVDGVPDSASVPVTLIPQITLACAPSALSRGDIVTCTPSSTSGSVTVSQWEFHPDSTALNAVGVYANAPAVWTGKVATSGTVIVRGAVGASAADSGTSHFTVSARTGWFARRVGVHIFETASDLPHNPTADSLLGNTTFDVELPTGTQDSITAGPNTGYYYMLSMHVEAPAIKINRSALQDTSAFVLSHPTTQTNGICSRATVVGLAGTGIGTISGHEGMNQETNSHTFLYFRKLNTFDSLGVFVEKLLSDNGPIVGLTVRENARIKARRDSALVSADSADTSGVNNEQLPCRLNYVY